MLRAVHVIDSMGRGGAEQALVNLLPALRSSGVECEVAVCDGPHDLVAPLQAAGIRVENLGLTSRLRLLGAATKLASMLKRTRAQVVHAHLFNAECVSAIGAAMSMSNMPRPLRVVTFHNLAYDMHPPTAPKQKLHLWVERLLVGRCFDVRLAVSRASALHYARFLRIAPPQVVPVGVPDALFESRPEEAMAGYGDGNRSGGNPPVVFMPARLSKEKGHSTMLRAAKLLAERGMRFELVIAGHGPLREEIEHDVHRLGIERVVSVKPAMSNAEVIDVMRRSRVVAVPSLSEGLSITAIEAMALGVPVVGSRVDGLAELVEDGVTGLTVPAGDAAALADATARVLGDDVLWKSLSGNARRAMAKYSASRIAAQLVRVYEDAGHVAAAAL